jgi:CopG family transcriptional regulator/antitoxin EndoAI
MCVEGKPLRTYQTMSLSLPPKLLKAITSQAKREGKTKSEFIREALRQYLELKELRRTQAVFSERAREVGITEEADVERIVDETRSKRARRKK